MTYRRAVLVALLASTPATAFAHHGWGSYDAQTPQTLRGVIERVEFTNPHATIWLRTAERTWEVVLGPPMRMSSRQVPERSLKVGEEVEVVGYLHRTHDGEIRAQSIKLGMQVTMLR